MHVLIINGSPRVRRYSNTEKLLDALCRGLDEAGASYERHAVSDRASWDAIRAAWVKNTEVLIALPLFVECVPGLLLELLETLPIKDEGTRLSFLLQGGFAEGCQLRCGEAFLQRLAPRLGVRYGGCLCKGDCFGLRVVNEEQLARLTDPFIAIGRRFAEGNGMCFEEARSITGAERFGLPTRLMYGAIFRTPAKKRFAAVAAEWGCRRPIDDRPWDRE